MAKFHPWLAGGIAFTVALALNAILTILFVVYTSKTNTSLNNNDVEGAKNNFKIASGIGYFLAALLFIGALKVASKAAREATARG